MQLSKGDELVSTLGLFKLVLNDADCSLNFYQFDPKSLSYASMGKRYTGNFNGTCAYLKIVDHSILTNASAVYLQLSSSNLSKVYLVIDDNAVIRFIGIKNPQGNLSPVDYEQIAYNNYYQPNTFVYLLDSHSQIADKLVTLTNIKNCTFQVSNQVLNINYTSQISKSFSLPAVYFDINGIYDNTN
jgi:hypothetical protein